VENKLVIVKGLGSGERDWRIKTALVYVLEEEGAIIWWIDEVAEEVITHNVLMQKKVPVSP